MFLRELKLPPPVSHHVISVRPAWRVCDRPPAEILHALPAQHSQALEYLGRRTVAYTPSGAYGDDVVAYRRR